MCGLTVQCRVHKNLPVVNSEPAVSRHGLTVVFHFPTLICLEVPESDPVWASYCITVVAYVGLYTLAFASGNTLPETLDINSSRPLLYFKGKYWTLAGHKANMKYACNSVTKASWLS